MWLNITLYFYAGLEIVETYRASFDKDSGKLSTPHAFPNRSWTQGVSILTSINSQIMLCDEKEPFKSKCYWLIVNGWKSEVTALRYCATNSIPATGYPKGTCKDLAETHLVIVYYCLNIIVTLCFNVLEHRHMPMLREAYRSPKSDAYRFSRD